MVEYKNILHSSGTRTQERQKYGNGCGISWKSGMTREPRTGAQKCQIFGHPGEDIGT